MKKWYKIFGIVVLAVCLSACGNEESTEKENKEEVPKKPKYNVEIEMICNENLFLSKYDINVFVNDDEVGTLEHGKSDTYSLELESGETVLRVENEEDSTVDGEIKFNVSEDMKLKCELSCKSDQIEIKETAEITPPIDITELGEENYTEVKKAFEEAGFTNIEKKVIKDLTEDRLNEKEIVTAISIGDNSSFTKEDKFMADTKVVIEYHSEKEIEVPESSSDYDNRDYQEVVKSFEDLGFKNIKTETATSFWEDGNNEVYEVEINGQSFAKGDSFLPDSEIVIRYYVSDESNTESGGKSSTELTKYYAQKAFEEFGESQYPFGFKCHWIMDLRNAEQEGNTWYFKVGVTITNAYGTEYDTVAEGMVTGTDSAPQMVQFNVSN